MNELTALANKYKSDKGILDTVEIMSHNYTEHYYKHWIDIQNSVENILEIGIGAELKHTKKAASLKMLRDFFVNANIYGIDVQERCIIEEKRIITYVCNQVDKIGLNALFSDIVFDVIIDDGGHNTVMQQATLGHMFKSVKSGGMYIVEDLHTSVWGDWGLPANHRDSCLQVLKKLRDEGEITTPHMEGAEREYLSRNVGEIHIIDTEKNGGNNDITAILYKV